MIGHIHATMHFEEFVHSPRAAGPLWVEINSRLWGGDQAGREMVRILNDTIRYNAPGSGFKKLRRSLRSRVREATNAIQTSGAAERLINQRWD